VTATVAGASVSMAASASSPVPVPMLQKRACSPCVRRISLNAGVAMVATQSASTSSTLGRKACSVT